ncbi:GlcG/HbpS family heme-binding protein [Actinomadura montaniterrae]|uniref:Heme-binding protein n=1 Tax=Actinomadura montaniterrae TaxID=1803903 RepID=A0A6L3VLS2_9ACTN|nr:heme-binding protein [Actinomadura montaniterrae]KAB2372619.1 heme-binding protein [Actinomadura montaniterrae]
MQEPQNTEAARESGKPRVRVRTLAGAAAGLAIVAGAVGVSAAGASASTAAPVKAPPAPQAVQDVRTLNTDAAMRIATAVQKEAAKQKQRVAVAIVDRSGDVRLVVKGDGAGPQTVESAKRKAFTAVSFGQPTSKLTGNATGDKPTVRDIPGTLFLAGGVPVASGGSPIAGIGVGGAPQGAIDESIAQAGLRAVQGQLG